MPRRALAAVPDQPRRVVAYRRVSALMGRSGEAFHSPDVQLQAIRRVTTGMVEVAIVDDIDRTGRHFAREGIDQIRAMAQAGHIDALAVYNVARLGRNVRESLAFLNELADQGVQILSATEPIDTATPAGRMMLTQMLAVAEWQSDEIGASWSRIIARRAAAGHQHRPPTGYEHRDKRMQPHPTLGPLMTEVFRRYAAGDPIGDICRYFAAVRGKRVIAGNLKKLLRNPVYLGHVVSGGEVLPGRHDPLVDPSTWQQVQDRLARDAQTPARHLAPTWSLVGLVYCPHGHHLQRQPSAYRDGSRVDRLACGVGTGRAFGDECPGVGRPLLDRVEAEVLRQVADYGRRLRDDHTARAARRAQVTRARADRATLERELAKVRAAMTKLARQWALGDVPDRAYRETMAEFRAAESTAAAELARSAPAGDAPEPAVAASAIDAMLAMWPDMTFAERGRALRSLVSRIVVRPAARWREPEEDRVDVRFHW